MTQDNWRAAFLRGCRVVVDIDGMAAAFGLLQRTLPVEGTVVGYSRDREALWIVRDGRKGTEIFPVRFVRRLEEPACPS